MAFAALESVGTAFGIFDDEVLGVPVGAGLWGVLVDVGFAPKVLPVVSIDALCLKRRI
jgi:hypothetical protein